jgi:chorismate mutase
LNPDPVVQAFRRQIADLDLAILEALNRRIGLVKRLKDHKEAQGLGFHDPAQERRLLDALAEANPGPLSEEGLREVFGIILARAKRDAAALEDPGAR